MHLRKEHNIDPEDVTEVICTTSPGQVKRNFEPEDIKYSPPSGYASISSIPYTVAAALVEGQFTLNQVSDEKVKDPRILHMAKKVKRAVDDGFRDYQNARVQIKLKDGSNYERYLENAIGSPQHPVPPELIEGKFKTISEHLISDSRIQQIIDTIAHLEDLERVDELMMLLKIDASAQKRP